MTGILIKKKREKRQKETQGEHYVTTKGENEERDVSTNQGKPRIASKH